VSDIVSTREVARRLKVSTPTVMSWYRQGRFKAYVDTTQDGGKTVRFDWSEVERGLGMDKRVEETQQRLADRGV